jgi:hypothetical protein
VTDGIASKARSLEQQNADNQRQRDGRHDQTGCPGHAAAHPPKHRATHHDGNEDIWSQPACPCCRSQRVPMEPPTPTLTEPLICTHIPVPSTLT